jgi:hypothetical protein
VIVVVIVTVSYCCWYLIIEFDLNLLFRIIHCWI